MTRLAVVAALAGLLLVGPLAGLGAAQETTLGEVAAAVDAEWIIVAAILVMFM